MKRCFSLLIFGLCAALLLSGCAGPAVSTGPGESSGSPSTSAVLPPAAAADLMQNVQAAPWPEEPEPLPADFSAATARFAARLLQQSATNPGTFMISPASVYLALAMTLNGADGTTKEAMLAVLSDHSLSSDSINQSARSWLTRLNRASGGTTVAVCNSIWFDQTFTPAAEFLQTNADYYGASARKLDFRAAETPAVINAWVKEATHGRIEKIVSEIKPDTVLYLINAIYFLADWAVPFAKNATHSQVFHAPAGDVSTDFMHRTGSMTALTLPGATGVALPYTDGDFVFFALLPDKDPRSWLAAQDPGRLFPDLLAAVQSPAVQMELALPKFESRYEDSLKDELEQMGLGPAFQPEQADFSRMNADRVRNLYISEIRHKSFVRVDEKGTEAAAATSVEMGVTSLPVSERRLVLDRPFVYGILDTKSGIPLFAGIMENPAA